MVALFTLSGSTVAAQSAGAEFEVMPVQTDGPIRPKIANGPGGLTVVFDAQIGYDLEAQVRAFGAGGQPRGDAQPLDAGAGSPTRHSAVATSANGASMAVWSIDDDPADTAVVRAARLDAEGNVMGAPFDVSEEPTGKHLYPSISADAQGNFVITWLWFHHQDEFDEQAAVFARRFAADGTPLGSVFQVDSVQDKQHYDAVVCSAANGMFVIVWWELESQTVFARRFGADGNPLGAEFVARADASNPDVACGKTGSFRVVYSMHTPEGQTTLRVRSFDRSGVARDDNVVRKPASFYVDTPSIATDSLGNSLVVWEQDKGTEASLEIRGRWLSPGGTAVGREFAVNTTSAGLQSQPSVDAMGRVFSVVWWSRPGESDSGLVGRRFRAAR